MAFCNSCGATLSAGMKFCNKCGAPQADAVASAGATPTPPATVMAPAPPPSTGGGSALKIILIVVAVVVGIGILGMVTCGVVLHRAIKSAKVSQQGDNVKADTPFGSFETSKDPEKIAKDLGVDLYPGAEMQKDASTSVTFGSIHTVTAVLESTDSVDKVCTFYKEKFPNATVTSSDQNRCNLVSSDQKDMITINIDADGDSTKVQITNVTRKSH
jgi:flagellar basal body-associated protein FliL